MERIEWTADLNLGIDVIDSQHRNIVDYINQLTEAIETQQDHEVLSVLEQLASYTIDHFVFEEELLEKAGYMEQEDHSELHRKFESKVYAMMTDFVSGSDPFSIARRTRNFLQMWLISHIRKEDAKYVPSVKKVIGRQQGWIESALKRIFGNADNNEDVYESPYQA
ncbi:MAG: hypothetical protein CMI08_05765 [Oceanospirillaceae bacterium]|uniref:bacteriohemerythrin n=1 Tax=unclassified Thalassolituus TaxID=2624967 RepID=UPI000C51A02C|nr:MULTISPECIES: bacteriohemerythrin [unclassified Thalassolituus]MAS25886.1 hypothetical protein [Oceanospirillaceae bacterium]MAX98704.1 hypothetical protein [Oceanospirillaceae bacterium]MBS52377.1 hypothetical protein [Oceanospirillaceae bacterium]|tara:strand:- start:97 stop:594 length:498 start_codon:yes stop_codon:yes gene_type:complete